MDLEEITQIKLWTVTKQWVKYGRWWKMLKVQFSAWVQEAVRIELSQWDISTRGFINRSCLTSMKELPWEAQVECEVGHMGTQLPLGIQQGLTKWEEECVEMMLFHECFNKELERMHAHIHISFCKFLSVNTNRLPVALLSTSFCLICFALLWFECLFHLILKGTTERKKNPLESRKVKFGGKWK